MDKSQGDIWQIDRKKNKEEILGALALACTL